MAAYIIIGLATIGLEIENPFGQDVNDLPLDTYCRQLATELDIMKASPVSSMDDFAPSEGNLLLYPLSTRAYPRWKESSVEDIRSALRSKVVAQCSPITLPSKKEFNYSETTLANASEGV